MDLLVGDVKWSLETEVKEHYSNLNESTGKKMVGAFKTEHNLLSGHPPLKQVDI